MSIGGINGYGESENCYNAGAISASFFSANPDCNYPYVGGINGSGSVITSYNIGTISASGTFAFRNMGGLAAPYAGGTVTNSYALNLYDGTNGTQLTSAQMKNKANYKEWSLGYATYGGWDSIEIWDISSSVNDGYPFLRNVPEGGGETSSNKIEFEYPNYSIPINSGKNIIAFISPVDFQVDNFTMTCFCSDPDAVAIQETYTKLDNGNYIAHLTLTARKLGNHTITLATKDGSCVATCQIAISAPTDLFSKADRYSFPHAAMATRPYVYRYYISEPDQITLQNKLNAYYGTKKGYLHWRKLNGILNEEWTGSCFGLASTALLDKLGKVEIRKNYGNNVTTLWDVSSPIDNLALRSVINYYFVSQCIPFIYYNYEQPETKPTATVLKDLVNRVKAGQLLLFDFGIDKNSDGHTIILYGYNEPVDGWHELKGLELFDLVWFQSE